MEDQLLRQPRKKRKAQGHTRKSPFPVPIATVIGRCAQDDHWYFYFGELQTSCISVKRIGDMTYLYHLGFFGRGLLSKSNPQFDVLGDVLATAARSHFPLKQRKGGADVSRLKEAHECSISERLRQHRVWATDAKLWFEHEKKEDVCEGLDSSSNLRQNADLPVANQKLIEDHSAESVAEFRASEDPNIDFLSVDDNFWLKEGPNSGKEKEQRLENMQDTRTEQASENVRIMEWDATSSVTEIFSLISKCAQKLDGQASTHSDFSGVTHSATSWNSSSAMPPGSGARFQDVGRPESRCCSELTSFEGASVDANLSQTDKRVPSPKQELVEKRQKLEDPYPISEFLVLDFTESFFLSFGLGCLSVANGASKMSIADMWRVFCERQNNFPFAYAVYQYLRGKGWVVRSGSLIGSDFLLYKDGMPFHHASYCVYVHAVNEESLSSNELWRVWNWKSLSCLNRVNSRLAKETLFCFVIKPRGLTADDLSSPSCLSKFRITEVVVRRWIPEKNRFMSNEIPPCPKTKDKEKM